MIIKDFRMPFSVINYASSEVRSYRNSYRLYVFSFGSPSVGELVFTSTSRRYVCRARDELIEYVLAAKALRGG